MLGSTIKNKSDEAMVQLHYYEPPEGYYVAFSGGKDSIVILDLVRRSGVKHDAHFNITSVDPPELMQFIKSNYSNVERHRPELTMFQLIEKNRLLPAGNVRFCCKHLKENGGGGRIVITGIRKAESFKRSQRNMFEVSRDDKSKKMIHLILDWTDADVWGYIRERELAYPCLYDEGWHRIGCIGCPMAGKHDLVMQFNRYPNHKKAYVNTIQNCLNEKPSPYFGTDAELMFEWWISGVSPKRFLGMKDQMTIRIM